MNSNERNDEASIKMNKILQSRMTGTTDDLVVINNNNNNTSINTTAKKKHKKTQIFFRTKTLKIKEQQHLI